MRNARNRCCPWTCPAQGAPVLGLHGAWSRHSALEPTDKPHHRTFAAGHEKAVEEEQGRIDLGHALCAFLFVEPQGAGVGGIAARQRPTGIATPVPFGSQNRVWFLCNLDMTIAFTLGAGNVRSRQWTRFCDSPRMPAEPLDGFDGKAGGPEGGVVLRFSAGKATAGQGGPLPPPRLVW